MDETLKKAWEGTGLLQAWDTAVRMEALENLADATLFATNSGDHVEVVPSEGKNEEEDGGGDEEDAEAAAAEAAPFVEALWRELPADGSP